MASKNKQVVDQRHYSVRPEWVWSKKNKGLTKVALLKITLSHPEVGYIERAFQSWLEEINATKAEENDYYMGGCRAVIEKGQKQAMQLILSSGGQDALESLDYYVQLMYESIIQNDEKVTVTWEELPLQ